MSVLESKSAENYYSAIKLYDPEKKYASSVHCAYYSCVQFMIHAVMKIERKTLSQLDADFQLWSNNGLNSGGTHVYYYNKIKTLYRNSNKLDQLVKISEIPQLKRIREDADYKDIVIDEPRCRQALDMADRILKNIKNTLQV